MNYLVGWRKWGIRRSDLVLEVGSGNHPLARSDVLVDMFISDSIERAGQSPVVIDRPFVCANAEMLPFRAGAFDFLVCLHTVEHLVNPEMFFEEAARVARRGVIVAPSETCERMFGTSPHRWLVSIRSGKLVLEGKKTDNWGLFGNTFHEAFISDRSFRKFFYARPDIFEVHYVWEGRIAYEVIRNGEVDPRLVKGRVDICQDVTPSRPNLCIKDMRSFIEVCARGSRSVLGKAVRLLFSGRRVDLDSMLACPICKREVTKSATRTYICNACFKEYPVRKDGVPLMLPALARNLEGQQW
ncbi:MAG: methyltransferase domain-containing protein [Anaerolineae bacterium]|nr:methyltransferase domain-containing protein [Anaerolineae bacterium]